MAEWKTTERATDVLTMLFAPTVMMMKVFWMSTLMIVIVMIPWMTTFTMTIVKMTMVSIVS